MKLFNKFKGTLIIISSVHWHFSWQRHHDIAAGFAHLGYKILFIEPLPKRWPHISEFMRVIERLRNTKEGGGTCKQEIPDGVEIYSPKLLPDTGNLAFLLNKILFLPRIIQKIKKRISIRPVYLINYIPIPSSLHLQLSLNPDVSAYDCVWDWENDPIAPHMHLIEEELIRKTDLVFADSPFLFNKMQQQVEKPIQILPAVQYNLFEKVRKNYKENTSNAIPKIAYFGNLKVNIDINLLKKLSQRYQLKLISPSQISRTGFSKKTEFIGGVSHLQLPQYLIEIDLLVLPYLRAAHTPAIIPAKTFECLATGLPVVAIGLPSLDKFSNYFYICKGESEFFSTIDLALKESPDKREERLKFAKEQDWSIRVKQIESCFLSLDQH